MESVSIKELKYKIVSCMIILFKMSLILNHADYIIKLKLKEIFSEVTEEYVLSCVRFFIRNENKR